MMLHIHATPPILLKKLTDTQPATIDVRKYHEKNVDDLLLVGIKQGYNYIGGWMRCRLSPFHAYMVQPQYNIIFSYCFHSNEDECEH